MRSHVTAIVVAAAILGGGGYAVVQGGGGGAPAGTANVWIDTTGGTCTRQGTPGAYVDAAACGSLGAAYTAASAGDTVRVKNGTYTSAQSITGSKASVVTFIGESKAGVLFTGSKTSVASDHLEFQDMTWEEDSHGASSIDTHPLETDGSSDLTLRNVDIMGDFPFVSIYGHSDFRWIGGRFGDFDGTPNTRLCGTDNQPILIGGGEQNVLIEGVTISYFVAEEPCGHLEAIRVQDATTANSDANAVVIRRNTFLATDVSSAVIFNSYAGGALHVKVVGNLFFSAGNVAISLENQDCSNVLVAYNTFSDTMGNYLCGTVGTFKLVGNIGASPSSTLSCSQFTANVRQSAINPGCSGNTWVSGSDSGHANLGLDSLLHLQAGSPGINAAETPGPSDVCTDTSIMGTLGDIDGDTRPTGGSKCDAGADEYTAG